jgi:hypothetical protein
MIPKKYFHDRVILLLLSSNVFVSTVATILVLLRLDTSRPEGYIVQYRCLPAFGAYCKLYGQKTGNVTTFISFIIFDLLILLFHIILSVRLYKIHRNLAVLVLAIGILLLILSLIVSYALLGNR